MGGFNSKQGQKTFPGENVGMNRQGVSDRNAEEQEVGREDETKSDHRRNAAWRLFKEVIKLSDKHRFRGKGYSQP